MEESQLFAAMSHALITAELNSYVEKGRRFESANIDLEHKVVELSAHLDDILESDVSEVVAEYECSVRRAAFHAGFMTAIRTIRDFTNCLSA